MAYSSEVGNVNVDVLKEKLKVDRKGAEVVFQNEELFIISPSIQNGSNWFDLRKINIERFYNSKKKGLLLLRHNTYFLIADLNDFTTQMMRKEDMKSTSTGGDHWKFNIISIGDFFTVFNLSNKNVLYSMKYSNVENLKKDVDKFIKSISAYSGEVDSDFSYEKELILDDLDNSEIIRHINNFLIAKGFNYSEEDIKNFYLSLRSKPFAIISGISGTGKTKIVQLFAEAIGATEKNGQFKLISIRPDWSDSSDLLGYRDIKGDFIKGPLTEMVENALANPQLPHFVLLDEMNLARVEYYFSDVLSVMESRKKDEEGNFTSSPLLPQYNEDLTLPGNLYIIGTVNMDETTHPFSKKVLDRANTIEFNEIDLLNFDSMMVNESGESDKPLTVSNDVLESTYIHLKDAFQTHEALIRKVSEIINTINKQLEPIYAQVGYRVRDEVSFYMAHNTEAGMLLTETEAMDFCIMQKILPRIGGTQNIVQPVLEELQSELKEYPKSKAKVEQMLERVKIDGFVSFWNA
ncbi:McrB family protein [Ureibacillus acetophenoni]|uniref:Dynein-related subfamily AAA family protein n=1 Tax=Ureibacillus acetophenoni TaxID=614649 RepID=A0A285UHV0_9BACL|nr:AAA family ATPase [Ureibacillus acetophenoni]SOC41460.1 dynein-related subfamily AAA family protein [Ureibacillus acetophenoni]